MKSRLLPVLFALVVILFTAVGAEVILRLFSQVDPDGQVRIAGRPLLPFQLPVASTREAIDRYRQCESEAYIVRDPELGWSLAANASGHEGLYRTNSAGIRSLPREYSRRPRPGVFRVALFGDSFTHGDEEPWEKSWAKFLGDELSSVGVRAEVLNFGVPGYGVGQAFLRWRREGPAWNPSVAVFGFQPENVNRVVNVFRQLYSSSSGMIFSKPRFYLTPEGRLEAANSPVADLALVPSLLAGLAEPGSPLGEFEYWFHPHYYRDFPLSGLRLVALFRTLCVQPPGSPGGKLDHRSGPAPLEPGSEAWAVTKALLREFSREAEAAGITPVILHIPDKSSLRAIAAGDSPAYLELLRELQEEGLRVVDPSPAMAGRHKLYKYAHLSSRGGRLLAAELARALLELSGGKGEEGK